VGASRVATVRSAIVVGVWTTAATLWLRCRKSFCPLVKSPRGPISSRMVALNVQLLPALVSDHQPNAGY
jgi:hypothetical protein